MVSRVKEEEGEGQDLDLNNNAGAVKVREEGVEGDQLQPADPHVDNKGNRITKVLKRDKQGRIAMAKVMQRFVDADGNVTFQEIPKVYMPKSGKWRVFTPSDTVDKRAVVLAVKEEYANFTREGVYEIQLRNMQYKLMEHTNLQLGYLQDPYSRLSAILVEARRGLIGLTKEDIEAGEPGDKYFVPDDS